MIYPLIALLAAIAACVTSRQESRIKIRPGIGDIWVEVDGTCSSDAEAQSGTTLATKIACKEGQWHEISRNQSAYQCIDGRFQSILRGRCQ